MDVVTESYRLESSAERSNDFEEMKVRRSQMCEELGLVAQMDAQAIAEEAAIFYGEITGYELLMWREFLQTAYSDWSEYTYDVIPEVALEDVRTAKSLNVFNALEIWTPEIPERPSRNDPMAVGITGAGRDRRFFPIVRWGMEELLSLEQIERIVALRYLRYSNKIPTTVLDYVISKFRESAAVSSYEMYQLYAGFMGRRKHCKKQMYRLRWEESFPDVKICAECGHVQEI